jgi:Rha family phage regulatory protein
MKDLVKVVDGEMMVNSMDVAKRFGKMHKNVLEAIKNLECDEDFSRLNFKPRDYINSRGRSYPSYDLTRDGFSFLCMGFTGKEAAHWKVQYIKAFNAMERELLKQHDKLEWKQARLQGRSVRRDFTDTIQRFVAYAEAQGSKSAGMYYANITKMEYKALGLLSSSDKTPSNFRDTLDLMDLGFLIVAEQVAKQAIEDGMARGSLYKDVYQFAKERVLSYAEVIKLPMLVKKPN